MFNIPKAPTVELEDKVLHGELEEQISVTNDIPTGVCSVKNNYVSVKEYNIAHGRVLLCTRKSAHCCATTVQTK